MEEGLEMSWKNGKTIWEGGKWKWRRAYKSAKTLNTWKPKSLHT